MATMTQTDIVAEVADILCQPSRTDRRLARADDGSWYTTDGMVSPSVPLGSNEIGAPRSYVLKMARELVERMAADTEIVDGCAVWRAEA